MSGIVNFVRQHVAALVKAGGKNPLSYERAWSVSIGHNEMVGSQVVKLNDGYFIVLKNTEKYAGEGLPKDGPSASKVQAHTFVFIGPFADADATIAMDHLSSWKQ